MLKNFARKLPSFANKRNFTTDQFKVLDLEKSHFPLVATVFGATGFTGRYIVQALARTGVQVVVPYRGEDWTFRDLKVLGDIGQIIPVRYDIRNEESIERAISHSNIVINLAGRNYDTRNFSLQDINVDAAERIARISQNVDRYIYVSALNASEDASSEFARTKALGEKVSRKHNPKATIVRPSIIFGDEDRFINKWSKVSQNWPFIPRFNSEHKIQPLHCSDFAKGILSTIENPQAVAKTCEFAGDETFTWDQFLDMIIEGTAQYDRLNLPVSTEFMKMVAGPMEQFSRDPNFIVDEIDYHNQDLVVVPKKDVLTLKDFGVKATPIQEKLIRLSRMYRPSKFFNAIANPQNK
ncbi:hypothetical protein DICPUDRAFT_97564 [Dictyostelium purpureum]|uniref:NAD-dependent epimerase/dehydratase domain-containing protein n=1 Tax=Dictyostelium purpureum TaxID=5786 RepID=F0ZHT6_DICPU|nr:uncharacterized protein DICPUDRAFT_97564 [Dictyostelium purpureum]EGC36479.1 hypothetical protein DICPUDRAFT_97564 [Dictyostelium purpureum]|eukprot:XP_003286992.1 hypothetical protein DICPUDRAFT_97564 [Dictyostelium purpureum]